MKIPVTHLRKGDRCDGYTFVSGYANSTGKYITTWYSPNGKLRVYALSQTDSVFPQHLAGI